MEHLEHPLHLYALRHTSPYVAFPETHLSYLDNCKVIFLGGSVIDAAQVAYFQTFVFFCMPFPITSGTCILTLEFIYFN